MGLTIYTGGTFDLFHAGHVNFLRQCAMLGDVIVSLNSDEFIATYKGKPPVMSYEEREAVLTACKFVAAVIKNEGGSDSRQAIEVAKPNVIAVGSDWATKDYYKQMGFNQQWLDEQGIWLCYIPYTSGISTTAIKQRL